MSFLRFLWIAIALTAVVPEASAHSLAEVETMIGGKEKYFQPVDKVAPGFSLLDAEGRTFGEVAAERRES